MAELNPKLGWGEVGRLNLTPRKPGEGSRVADRPVEVNRLFGVPEAKAVEKRIWEKPWHRTAAFMFATGKVTIKQVAEQCEVSQFSVRSLMKNAWFQETIIALMKDMGGTSVLELFKAEQLNSLLTLVELRDDAKQTGSVRRASAVDILDRAMGKPIQTVITDNTVRSADPVAEAEQLKESIQRKQDDLKKAGVLDLEVLPEEQLAERRDNSLLPDNGNLSSPGTSGAESVEGG